MCREGRYKLRCDHRANNGALEKVVDLWWLVEWTGEKKNNGSQCPSFFRRYPLSDVLVLFTLV